MATPYTPLRHLPETAGYKENDVLVVFGELFQRGYANGIVDEAINKGMKVIYATVGRRDENHQLRPLNNEEIKEKMVEHLINIPLEAGFDLQPAKDGTTPVDQLSGVKMSEWNQVELDWDKIEESRVAGVESFRGRVNDYLSELEKLIPEKSNVLFVHTMAGGFPRAKIVMPCTNRVFKGIGPRYASSEEFWNSQIGRLCDISFNEVTGETLKHLIDLSSPLRKKLQDSGAHVSYLAYGYHGTECLVGDEYRWQSYSPYLQGFAKLRLEEVAQEAWAQGVKTCVFNVPEILTNSSSIFLGVEVALYPLIKALQKESGNSESVEQVFVQCQALLKEEFNLQAIMDYTQKYLTNEVVQSSSQFEGWPQHNSPEQMEVMRNSSSELIDMHKDRKDLMTAVLSEVVFKACGSLMLNESWNLQNPICWIGHDLVAKQAGYLE